MIYQSNRMKPWTKKVKSAQRTNKFINIKLKFLCINLTSGFGNKLLKKYIYAQRSSANHFNKICTTLKMQLLKRIFNFLEIISFPYLANLTLTEWGVSFSFFLSFFLFNIFTDHQFFYVRLWWYRMCQRQCLLCKTKTK